MNTIPRETRESWAKSIVPSLREYEGARVYFEELEGNHGDTLITMGANELFSRLSISRATSPEDSEAIVINGGGGYGVELPGNDFSLFRKYLEGFRNKPVVVLPSTFHFPSFDFAALVRGRCAPTHLFARDAVSYQNLQKFGGLPSNISLHLAHDLAFLLMETPFVEKLRAKCKEEFLLVVERIDKESDSYRPAVLRISPWARRLLPNTVKCALKDVLLWSRRTDPFVRRAICIARERGVSFPEDDCVYRDISPKHNATWEGFLDCICRAKYIVSSRLHVGILGLMLGKPVVLSDAMRGYPKLRAVYEHSLTGCPNVEYIPELNSLDQAK